MNSSTGENKSQWKIIESIFYLLEFWTPRRGFRIPGTRFRLSVELGFQIPIFSGIRNP